MRARQSGRDRGQAGPPAPTVLGIPVYEAPGYPPQTERLQLVHHKDGRITVIHPIGSPISFGCSYPPVRP